MLPGNNGIHMYPSACVCGFGFEHKYWRVDGFGGKKGTDRQICIPLFTALMYVQSFMTSNRLNCKSMENSSGNNSVQKAYEYKWNSNTSKESHRTEDDIILIK